jgi:hypothetical protein
MIIRWSLEKENGVIWTGFIWLSMETRRRRKEKSQIRDSKIWSLVPRDSDPRKSTLARASIIYK